jgi:S1/P1 Nuclease
LKAKESHEQAPSQIDRISRGHIFVSSRGTCERLEHPRPHALCCDRLPDSPARESADHRESKSRAGETLLYANQWQARLQDVPVADHGLVLFMQAARWSDDIRRADKQHHRGPWHYTNWPFKPLGQLASVQIRDPEPVNILTAMAENESVVKKENDSERRAIALASLVHLVGDIHQPLHTAQIFTVDYPKGDRGGNEICVRVTQAGQPMDLHRFWDGVITSSSNLTRIRNGPRHSETAKSFSEASSPNLRALTLKDGLKRASRLRRRSLTVTGYGLGFLGAVAWTARW